MTRRRGGCAPGCLYGPGWLLIVAVVLGAVVVAVFWPLALRVGWVARPGLPAARITNGRATCRSLGLPLCHAPPAPARENAPSCHRLTRFKP